MDSKLQIISGAYRGRKLVLPDGIARPTQNRARIALFNMLMSMVDGMSKLVVWDAFAGSGAFGVECLSRFAGAQAIFTDTDDASIRAIRRNVGDVMGARATIDKNDALRMVSKYGPMADVIFVDPPYSAASVGCGFMDKLAKNVRSGTIVIWEQDAMNAVLPGDSWDVLRDKQYGRARFFILERR